MKKYLILFAMNALLMTSLVFGQTPAITDVIVPQYIQGMNGTNSTRTPYAFRVTLSGLTPNAAYRYYNQVVLATDLATAGGAGNVAFVNYNGAFTMTSSCDLSKAGGYSTFTTDATGSYTGWFITIPTSNARFTPGNQLYCRISLNDGGSGTTAATRLTTANYATVINYGTTSPAAVTEGTGIYGFSIAADRDFVFLYENEAGTGRPISGAFIENDSLALPATTTPAFYLTNVDGKAGAWGTIIPNSLPNGIKRIERRALLTGEVLASAASADGIWSGVSTVNPTAGVAAIEIGAATLPVEMTSFSASVNKNDVSLRWTTATETNNYGFEIQRASKNSSWEKIGFVKGNLTSTISCEYSYTDKNVKTGKYAYRLKQLDMNGKYEFSSVVETETAAPKEFALSQNYPNPFNPSTVISYQVPQAGLVTLKVYNVIGSEVASVVSEMKDAGSYTATFNASKIPSGIYLYKLTAGNLSLTKKMMLIK